MSPVLDTPPTTERTRIYRGRTVEELLPKIQVELGADAVVVRREKGLTGGFAGFFQRPFVEIEARGGTPAIDCYDEDGAPALPEPLPAPTVGSANGARANGVKPAIAGVPEHVASEPQEFRELLPAAALPHELTPALSPSEEDNPFAAALAEAEAAVPAALPGRPVAATLPRTPAASAAPAGRTRAAIERALLGTGMSEAFVGELIETAAAHVLPQMPGRPSLAKAVHATLMQRIPSCAPLPPGGAALAVVGPGGAGKSSCCAALLDAYHRRSTLPAACATLSAELSAGERTGLLQARAQGVLLLDTTAVSPADPASICSLAALLGELRVDRVVLALPATLGAKPAAQLLDALAPMRVGALAITHADETDQLGVAVQTACAFDVAPAYLLARPDRSRTRGGLTPINPIDLANKLLPPR